MAGSSETTTDHEVIRRWAEARGGRPAAVRDTGGKGDAGLLRIDFEEREPDDRLESIEWDAFFEKFEEAGLAFLYQDTLKSGEQSRFFKFVQREGTSRDMGGRGKRGSRGSGSADEGDGGEKKRAPRKAKAASAEGGGQEEKKATRSRKADLKADEEKKARAEEEKRRKDEEKKAKAEAAAREKEEKRRRAEEEKRRKEEERKKVDEEKQARAKEEKKPASRSRKVDVKAEAEARDEKKATSRNPKDGGDKEEKKPARKAKSEDKGGGGGRRSSSSSQTTTDHEVIRRWAEERQGFPAHVRDTGGGEDAGLLRIDFEEREPDDRLERIEWDAFFQKFEEAGLAFLYQDTLKSGEQSRFFKFVQREGVDREMGGRGKR